MGTARLITSERVYLVGMMGSGKSTVGEQLAMNLEREFYDTDNIIEADYGKRVHELFQFEGEAAFRRAEYSTLHKLMSKTNAVISTGGGLPCHSGLMDVMLESGVVIYLRATPEVLARRLSRVSTRRPLIDRDDMEPEDILDRYLTRREKVYAMAHVEVDTDKRSIGDVVREIVGSLRDLPGFADQSRIS